MNDRLIIPEDKRAGGPSHYTALVEKYRWVLVVLLGCLLVANFIFDYHNPIWALIDGIAVVGVTIRFLSRSR